jgi:CRP-like cAMP-binding protein
MARSIKARSNDATRFIAANGWLKACSPDFRDWIVPNLKFRNHAAGEAVSHGGDTGGGLYCLAEGQVGFRASNDSADVEMSYVGLPGVWWGHAPLLGGKRVGTVTATTHAVCGEVPLAALQARLNAHPKGWREISLGLAALYVEAAGAHADLLPAASDRRIAATILRLGGYRHSLFAAPPPAGFACTQDQLAGATALSRNTVGEILRGFADAGMVVAHYGQIKIVDPARLMHVADQS